MPPPMTANAPVMMMRGGRIAAGIALDSTLMILVLVFFSETSHLMGGHAGQSTFLLFREQSTEDYRQLLAMAREHNLSSDIYEFLEESASTESLKNPL